MHRMPVIAQLSSISTFAAHRTIFGRRHRIFGRRHARVSQLTMRILVLRHIKWQCSPSAAMGMLPLVSEPGATWAHF